MKIFNGFDRNAKLSLNICINYITCCLASALVFTFTHVCILIYQQLMVKNILYLEKKGLE